MNLRVYCFYQTDAIMLRSEPCGGHVIWNRMFGSCCCCFIHFFFWILVKPGSSQKTSSNKPKPKNTSTILRAEIKHLQGGLLMKFSFPTKTKRLSHLCNFNPKLDSSLRRTLYFWLQKMQKNNKPNVTLMCSGNNECVQH